MAEKPKFGHDTLIPMSFVIVLLGGAFWLTSIYNQGNANADAIKQDQVWKDRMERRVFLIMGALKVKDIPEGKPNE